MDYWERHGNKGYLEYHDGNTLRRRANWRDYCKQDNTSHLVMQCLTFQTDRNNMFREIREIPYGTSALLLDCNSDVLRFFLGVIFPFLEFRFSSLLCHIVSSGGNPSRWRRPPPNHKSWATFSHAQAGIELLLRWHVKIYSIEQMENMADSREHKRNVQT